VSSGILLLQDKRVVEKIEMWGSMLWPVPLEILLMISLGLLRGSMVQISTVVEGLFGRSWLDFLVGGICLGASEATSMSSVSLAKDRGKLVFALR